MRPACHARTTGADQQNRLARRVGQTLTKALGKAPKIRVVPKPPPLAEHHGVHSPDLAGRIREVINKRRRGLFVGKGDIQPGETLRLGLRDDRAQIIGLPRLLWIEKIIAIVKVLASPFGHMHGGCARALNTMSDQPNAERNSAFI